MREKLRLSFGTKTIWVAVLPFFTFSVKAANESWNSPNDSIHFDAKGIPILSTSFKQKTRFCNKDEFSLDPLLVGVKKSQA